MKQSMQAMVILGGCALISCAAALAQESEPTISTAYVSINCDRGVSDADGKKVADFLDQQDTTLRRLLGVQDTAKIAVRVYDSIGKFLGEAGLKTPWRMAIFTRGVIFVQPVRALVQRRKFDKALSYEFARAYLVPVGQKGCPPWLIEAFASYHSGEVEDLTPPVGAQLSAFSDLAQNLQDYTEPPQRDDVHFILSHTMAYLVGKYGEAKAFGLFKAFDGTTPVEGVFKKVLGDDYSTVEKGWAKYIAYQTRPFKTKSN